MQSRNHFVDTCTKCIQRSIISSIEKFELYVPASTCHDILMLLNLLPVRFSKHDNQINILYEILFTLSLVVWKITSIYKNESDDLL